MKYDPDYMHEIPDFLGNPLGEQFDVPRRKPSATKTQVRTNDKRAQNKRKKAARKKNR